MLRRVLCLLGVVSITIGLSACALQTLLALPAQPTADLPIFDNALGAGFESWSFDASPNFAVITPTYDGSSRAIGVTYQAGNWGALWLMHPGSDIDLTGYTAIQFAIHGGAAGGQALRVQAGPGANYPAANEVALTDYLPGGPVADQWRVVTIPLTDLNLAGGALGSVAFQSDVSTGQPVFYLDDLRLLSGATPPPPVGTDARITIQVTGPITPVDARILGSNLPAWLNPSRFEDATFRARTAAASIAVLRMPGGSWGNHYGWLSCEMGVDQSGALPCAWPWAARPTDFINFLTATGAQGMWIVSPNGTAQEAAAAVAFFNGVITDTQSIGIDLHGTNWYTVGHWAALRTAGGNPTPIGFKLWEVGNEVYGGTPAAGGALCQSWGWEDVWTCDGAEYVNGRGSGATRREGYLEFRAAMRAVDPTILVGAVGYETPGDLAAPSWENYNNWGVKVMAAAGDALDFYAIHPYAYFAPPANNTAGHAAILANPQSHWAAMRSDLDAAFAAVAGGRRAPIAATEFNLVSVQDQDNEQLMTRAVNALFLADTIGQAIQHGYAMLNQWDLANGRAANGTEYGLMHEDNAYFRAPQYYVYPLWARFGDAMLPVTTTLDAVAQASVYAGRVDDATLSLLAVNKSATPITATIAAGAAFPITGGAAYEVRATSPAAQVVTYNGSATPSDALTEAPAALAATDGAVVYVLAPWSLTLLHLQVGASSTLTPTLYLPALWRDR